MYKQVILLILDGWGYREEKAHNAIKQASTPFFDHIWATYPHCLLEASGKAVGLPEGCMGNSEVGHLTIGTGTIHHTDCVRISEAAVDKQFHSNEALQKLFDHVKKHDATLHIQGLLSDAGVHSHEDHLYAIIDAAYTRGVKDVALHIFTDGRDTPPQSALHYIKKLEQHLAAMHYGRIATVTGRYFAMDRDNNWERTKKTKDALFLGTGRVCQAGACAAVEAWYAEGIHDEHIEPTIVTGPQACVIKKNDGVLFFNFRADRARQLMRLILEEQPSLNLHCASMTEYNPSFSCSVAYQRKNHTESLAHTIAQAGLAQTHIAETEKYAHVTYFLNGGVQEAHHGERYLLIESRKDIKHHDQAPEMRAQEIAQAVVQEIEVGTPFIVTNFANADVVGHTAKMSATIQAIETIDRALKTIVHSALKKNTLVFITADHGNAEYLFDSASGQPCTSHTTNPVPALMLDKKLHLHNGTLADVAPTVLARFGITPPRSMTGRDLCN